MTELWSLGPVWQVGFVVRSLEDALQRFPKAVGVGPWSIWTYSPETCRHLEVRGREEAICFRIAISASSNPQVELVQALTGPSIYREWLDLHGEGIHHLGFLVDNLREGMRLMKEHGHTPIQAGWGYGAKGDGGWAYYDFGGELNIILEIIEPPVERRPPESVFSGS